MIDKLTAALRAAPVTFPALAAATLFIVWATGQAGYPLTHWAPGGLIVLALLVLALLALRPRLQELPRAVQIALAGLAGYTALSFLSILWAKVPADAWEGANRTLLYLLVFALFACWRQHGVTATLLLCAWIGAMTVLAVFVVLHVDGAAGAALRSMLPGGRLTYPADYANANAAQWLIAAWPALMLAAGAQLHWALRGALSAAAVLLAEVALLSQSRGSLYATPIMLVLVFALLPARARTFAVLVPVAAGVAAAAPAVLRVGNHLRNGAVVPATLHSASVAMFAAAAIVGLVVAVAAAIEARLALPPATADKVRTGVGAIAIATLVAVLAAGWIAAGNPVTRIRHAWDTFKSPRGYAANASGSRLTSGLGSQRYDFYRVSLNEFVAHPVLGIGADNFQQQYLVHGRSQETPRYPHSFELRTLTETGLLGAALMIVGLGAAVIAGLRACRPAAVRARDPLGATAAAAALAGFAYWLVHGSFDWFFEFAGLGAPAFALLGLACSLAPRAPAARAAPRRRLVRAGAFVGALAALAAAASLAAPWLSGLETDDAVRIWPKAPLQAYARLDDAAQLNPLSAEPYLLAGSIALRFGDLARARREFTRALGRAPDDAYATLELGAIASALGERRAARALLERALRLQPRDQLTRAAVALARRGQAVDINELNRAILLKGAELR